MRSETLQGGKANSFKKEGYILKEIKKIIFVSKGATCRPPMAACILSRMELKGSPEIIARGLVVLMPEPLNQKAEAVLISNNMGWDGYMSQQLEKEDITDGTVIFTFEKSLNDKVIEKFEGAESYVLTNYVGDELEIMDPYGEGVQMYGLCFETLSNSLKKLADIINYK